MPCGQHLSRRDACDIDMHVDAVHERPAHTSLILMYLALRAGARALGVAEKAAGARVGGRHQHEARREADASIGSRDHHFAGLHGLPNALQHRRGEFRQLVQKQHPVMR